MCLSPLSFHPVLQWEDAETAAFDFVGVFLVVWDSKAHTGGVVTVEYSMTSLGVMVVLYALAGSILKETTVGGCCHDMNLPQHVLG